MREPAHDCEAVRRAAQQGARSVSRGRQCLADAVAATVDRWEDAVLRGRTIVDLERWAFRVAANSARAIAARARSRRERNGAMDPGAIDEPLSRLLIQETGEAPVGNAKRRVLHALLARRGKCLRGRQLEVVLLLARPGMTFHRAAKELAMARFNVKRAFRSALRRLSMD